MPKTLLQQALDNNDVPAGTIQDKTNKGWTRLKRPKGTRCPFGEQHSKNCNVRIRQYDDGYQLRCFSNTCRGRTKQRHTMLGHTKEEWEKMQPPVWTADMF